MLTWMCENLITDIHVVSVKPSNVYFVLKSVDLSKGRFCSQINCGIWDSTTVSTICIPASSKQSPQHKRILFVWQKCLWNLILLFPAKMKFYTICWKAVYFAFFETCYFMGFPRSDDLHYAGTIQRQTGPSKWRILMWRKRTSHTLPHPLVFGLCSDLMKHNQQS